MASSGPSAAFGRRERTRFRSANVVYRHGFMVLAARRSPITSLTDIVKEPNDLSQSAPT
jgi:hypothetical protein